MEVVFDWSIFMFATEIFVGTKYGSQEIFFNSFDNDTANGVISPARIQAGVWGFLADISIPSYNYLVVDSIIIWSVLYKYLQ